METSYLMFQEDYQKMIEKNLELDGLFTKEQLRNKDLCETLKD